MSHDVKYIGMDVHKEAVVIAVPNESGKQVIESVIETKASSILQFLHGLRGELHVTWEVAAACFSPERRMKEERDRPTLRDPSTIIALIFGRGYTITFIAAPGFEGVQPLTT